MIRRTVYLSLLLGVLALLPFTFAQSSGTQSSGIQSSGIQSSGAQAQDDLLNTYQEAFAALNTSVKALPNDSALSAEQLERAELGLTALADNAPAPLISGLSDTFGRARDAIRNRSQVDLAVQAAVLKGGFHRLVYEAALQDAATGNLARASADSRNSPPTWVSPPKRAAP